MINGFPIIDRIKSEEEFHTLVRLAKEDNHGVFEPTHPIRKGGQLVGYFSVGQQNIPIVFAWLSTKEITNRDSFNLINTVENFSYLQGAKAICFPVPKSSPFHEVMESMGFKPAGEYTFFVKGL